MDITNDNDYFELEPFEQYRPNESKFSSSLKWLLSKSNQTCLSEPFFEENELGKSLRAEIVQELISGNLYCSACSNLFSTKFDNLNNVIEYMASNSIIVTDENDEPVTWQIISQDSPFYVTAHLALIDSIMMYHSLKIMQFDKVYSSLKKYKKNIPNDKMPSNLEQLCTFWLNNITKIVTECLEDECQIYGRQSSLIKCQPHIFLNQIEHDIAESLSCGTILSVLIVFFTSDFEIDLNDICLQENVGFEERVENLNLIKEFCEKFLGPKSFCFSFEDFLYSPLEMNINKLAFIAELFYFFEINPIPNLVDVNHFEKFKEYVKKYMKKHYHATTPFLSARISDVTRNSFIKKSPYTPSQSTEIKMSKAESNASSLLDNVSLEASNNFEFVATSFASKFKLNENGDYAEIENDEDDLNNEEMPMSEQNGMFSSRTYVKLSSTNRMNFDENTQDKNSDNSSLEETGMKTVNLNSSSTNVTEKKNAVIDKSTDLVRRLSVTARPGDIFYKVKDVTETSSNTDNSEHNQDNEEQEIVIKPQETSMNTWRKTTTWNSKRNQQSDSDSGRQTPRQDLDKMSTDKIEPGSPMFAKELLSIRQAMEARRLDMILNYNLRMQLKEKKSSMERDKRKLETELEKQRQNIGKQVFLQVVQKKTQNKDQVLQIGESQKPTHSPNNSTCESPTPSQLTSSPNSSTLSHTIREATRRQWDKTPKNFINDFEQSNKEDYLSNNHNTGTSSVSSLSTPNSSAAQSPPLNSTKKIPSPKSNTESMTVDLTKAYYSRDEVIKAIESLKDKYINSSTMKKNSQSPSANSSSNNMVKDIEVLNNKLTELQAEINRLTLMQQSKPTNTIDTVHVTHTDQDSEQKQEQESDQNEQTENQNGSFFVSIGSGGAKREKPTLSSKKNFIFVKTNDEKAEKKPTTNTTNNLLMTANKNGKSYSNGMQTADEAKQHLNDGNDGDIDVSDRDTLDYKQRKREMIIQRQIERRQQQEMRRMQLEEERSRKAEELRQKEEELAMKKMVEKNRKETIFQAYIDKKKQSEIESMSGCFGPPNSLSSAKRFHSTNRLKSSAKSNTQNLFDQFDQASVYSERSTNGQYSSNTMVKTYSSNNLYQVGPNKNLAPSNKKASRVSRPPSCARPTISSLRKMNRTFSLNNVSDVGQATPKQPEAEPNILPLTQASLAMANAASSFSQNNDSVMRMITDSNSKLGSKYASSNYLSDLPRQFQPQATRTTPRRRTPRNPEEYLLSQGITDPQGYLSKGYYVGSMLDLSQFAKPAQSSELTETKADEHQPSSSSSSSMNGFQKSQKSFFLQANNNVKRRNSVHETSLSMANLNFMANADTCSFDSKTTSRNQKYYRALNNYSKMRSMTANIVHGPGQYDEQLNDGSNGSSATGSDSSSSPTPSMQQQKLGYHGGLGPLMSAVSKMENLSTISPSSTKTLNTFIDNRYHNEDEYDDYEYLERNLGAEPLNSSFNQRNKKDINTTATTNVTDYYTDESNSCHNDDILSNQFIQHQLGKESFLAKNCLTPNKLTAQNQAHHHHHHHSNSNHQVVNNWDHTSLASTNSIYSGDDSLSIVLVETSSRLASRRPGLSNRQPINTSFIISASMDSSSISLTDESIVKNKPADSASLKMMNSNKTASNAHLVDKQSPSTNTYGRKRGAIPSSATFCSTKTPDQGPKRVSHLTNKNNFINQSPSLNLNNINEADYSGPKLYKRLTGKTNKSTIVNSLNQLVLAGTVNAQLRKQVIEEIEASDARHFVILFRDYHLQYRGVYSYTSESDYIEKIIGQGPAKINEDMIEKYYKYNSGGKQFSSVQTKHLSIQCDAVTIHSAYWQTRKASNPVTNLNQMGYNQTQYSTYSQSSMAGNQGTLRR